MIDVLYTVLEFIFNLGLIVVMAFFAYMSSHLVSEKKAGKTIPLPWEKKHEKQTVDSVGSQTNGTKRKRKNANASAKGIVFNKSKVKYFDGDNT